MWASVGESDVTRVLMGDFDALRRLGLEDIVAAHGAQLVTTTGRDLLDDLVAALPDVVVLDLDKPETVGLARTITKTFPAVRVVACSSAHPRMRIYPPRHYGEFYDSALEPEQLKAAFEG